MKKIVFSFLVIALISITFGCKSRSEYERVAKAGQTYYAAIDNLLIAANDIAIDANSERLLAQHDDYTSLPTPRGLPEDQYKTTTDNDKRRFQAISRLRKHSRLVARYYDLLYQLATSDSPERTQEAIGGLATNLNSFGNTIRGNDIVKKDLLSAATGAIVTSIIRGKLRDEIRQRRPLIERELDTQAVLLDELAAGIKKNIEDTTMLIENRRVISKISGTKKLSNREKDQWIRERRKIVVALNTVDELGKASGAIRRLNRAFADFDSKKLTLSRADELLADFESILNIAIELRESE